MTEDTNPPSPPTPCGSFHFHEVGDFTFLEEGDGWKVDVTFGGLTTQEGQQAGAEEKSFTLAMRIISPHGDMVSCSLPYLFPNTSRLEAVATPGTDTVMANAIHLSPDTRSVTLGQMSVTAGEPWALDGFVPRF